MVGPEVQCGRGQALQSAAWPQECFLRFFGGGGGSLQKSLARLWAWGEGGAGVVAPKY